VKSLLRVIRYIHPYRQLAYATLLAAMLTTLMDLVPPWLVKVVIDDVIKAGHLVLLKWVIGALVGVYLLKNLLNMARIRFNNTLEQKVIYRMRDEVYRALQNLSISYFDNRATGEMMSRVNSDVNNLERIIIDGVEAIVMASLTLLGISVMLFAIDWKLALLALLPIPFLALGASIFTRKVHSLYHQLRQKLAQLNALLQDNLSGIREIMAFNRQEYERGRFNKKSQGYCETQLKVARLWSFYSPGMIFLGSMGTVLILSFGAHQVVQGRMTVGELVAFLSYLALFYTPINQIHSVNHMLQHALASGERVFEIIDARPEVQDPEDPITPAAALHPHGPPDIKVLGYVAFRRVSFDYREDVPVLRDVDFEVQPGEKIALVGPSGSGKSTLIKLLMRFYDVDQGSITIDGVDIRRFKLSDLRDQIAMVQQEPFLFNGTVRENILYGDLSADEDRIIAAAKAARAHEFIENLPEGYATWIGERGVKLSVGQKQRLAIARALLKDPPIIILDEATSNIDTETEAKIQEALECLIQNRTTFIIAHRLSTLKHVDRILVIKNGRVVESGTHEELLQLKGLYTTLYEAQFQIE
jgi:ATP-binding cassette subfamily B protein/subfamily B ATP-binding cassette protein MsbA